MARRGRQPGKREIRGGEAVMVAAADSPAVRRLAHSLDFSAVSSDEELLLLKKLLAKHASDPIHVRYAKITKHFTNKSILDVALLCKWASLKADFREKKNGRVRMKTTKGKKVDSFAQSPAHQPASLDCPSTSSSICNAQPPRLDFPSTSSSIRKAQPPRLDCLPCSHKDIDGQMEQLLEQNQKAFDQISKNLATFKIQENINLFCEIQNNINKMLNGLHTGSMSNRGMPPIPVKINEELAIYILLNCKPGADQPSH